MNTVEYTEKLRQALQFDTTLRQLAAQATTRYAGEKARIDRGLVLALNGHVTRNVDGCERCPQRLWRGSRLPRGAWHLRLPRLHTRTGRPLQASLRRLSRQDVQSRAGAYHTSTTPAQGLVLGGHKATADAQREADGDLVRKVCTHNGARRT